MRFFTSALIGASALLVTAQSLLPSGSVSTSLFFSDAQPLVSVRAGEPITIKYQSANPDQPATVTLVKGAQTELVAQNIVTSSATGGSFTWTPSSDIPSASNYALLIQQGSEFNYGGQFAITGGAAASSIASAAVTASSAAASSAASAAASLSSSLSAAISSIAASAAPTGHANATISGHSASRTGPAPTGASPTNSAPATNPAGAAASLERPAALAMGALALLAFF